MSDLTQNLAYLAGRDESPYLDSFVRSYLECAAWSSGDGEENESFEAFDFASETESKAREDCAAFIALDDETGYLDSLAPNRPGRIFGLLGAGTARVSGIGA
jgi:hypothetical protein